jgi:hypothetical protein
LGFDIKQINGKNIPGVYVPNIPELKIVTSIMMTFVRYGSYRETLTYLEKNDIRNKNNSHFKMSTLRRLLTDLRYIGEWECNKKNKDADVNFLAKYEQYKKVGLPFGPQIDLILWQQVQELVATINQRTKIRNKSNSAPYLLSVVLQAKDGSSFHGSSAHGRTCRKRYYNNTKHKIRINADIVEEEARKILLKTASQSKDFAAALLNYTDHSMINTKAISAKIKQLQQDQQQITLDRQRLEKRLDYLLDGGTSDECQRFKTEYKSGMEELEAKKTSIEAELFQCEEKLKQASEAKVDKKNLIVLAEKVLDHLNKNDPAAIKMAYRMLFEKIVAVPDASSGVMKLYFTYKQGDSEERNVHDQEEVFAGKPGITGQENSQVTLKVVGAQGLEPRILRL